MLFLDKVTTLAIFSNISASKSVSAEEDTPTYTNRHGLVTLEEGEGRVKALAS